MAAKRKSAPRKAPSRRTGAGKALVKRRAGSRAKPASRSLKARPLKRVTPRRRRKVSAYQSALSIISSYLDRGGRTLPRAAKKVLTQAKTELSRLYHRR